MAFLALLINQQSLTAMKIHISAETKLLLDALGGFRTEHRGLIELKFKGLVDTYWLLGKEGGVGHKEGLDSDQEYDINEGPEYMKELTDPSMKKTAAHDSSMTPLTPKLENLIR